MASITTFDETWTEGHRRALGSRRELMERSECTNNVRKQYEILPYPVRDPLDEDRRLVRTVGDDLVKVNHYCFGGKETFQERFRVLVAGCGTGDAVIYLAEQLRDTDAVVTGMDISEASLRIAGQRAKQRDLKNVTLLHDSILRLPSMQLGVFDYINCSGVLHHLRQPIEGLKALESVLSDKGAVNLMVYAEYGRNGVTQLQKILRLLNQDRTELREKIGVTRRLLESLPTGHWFERERDWWATDLELYGDAGICDLLLHCQETTYDIPRLYELVDEAGLHLVAFVGERFESPEGYRPETYIKDGKLLDGIRQLPKRAQEALAELVSGSIRKHTTYLTRQPNTVADVFDVQNVPFFHSIDRRDLLLQLETHPRTRMGIGGPAARIEYDPGMFGRDIVTLVDGFNATADVLRGLRGLYGPSGPAVRELFLEFRAMFELFNSADWMFLRDPRVSGSALHSL